MMWVWVCVLMVLVLLPPGLVSLQPLLRALPTKLAPLHLVIVRKRRR